MSAEKLDMQTSPGPCAFPISTRHTSWLLALGCFLSLHLGSPRLVHADTCDGPEPPTPCWQPPPDNVPGNDPFGGSNGYDIIGDKGIQVQINTSTGAPRGEKAAEGVKLDPKKTTWTATQQASPGASKKAGRDAGSKKRDENQQATDQAAKDKGTGIVGALEWAAKPFKLMFTPSDTSGYDHANPVSPAATDGVTSHTDPVNTANGELEITQTDLAFPGFGVPFQLVRTYRSRADFQGPMGFAQDHSYNQRIIPTQSAGCVGEVIWMTGQATSLTFRVASKTTTITTYESPKGVQARLVLDATVPTRSGPGEWTLTWPDGARARFDSHGLVSRIESSTGHGLTIEWEGKPESDAHVTKVIDSVGREVVFTYTNQLLTSVTHQASGLSVTYHQDAHGDLDFVRDAAGHEHHYEYYFDAALETLPHDYQAEQFLGASCEQACSPSQSSCDAGGACDSIIAEVRDQCIDGCTECLADCPDACDGACQDTCRNGTPAIDGSPATPGCQGECNTQCAQASGATGGPNQFKQECQKLYDEGVDDYCHECEDDCEDACGRGCDAALFCISGSFDESSGEGELDQSQAANCLSGFGNWIASAWDGTQVISQGLWDTFLCVGSVVWCAGGLFCDPDCDYDNTEAMTEHFCANNCKKCCKWGEGDACLEDSCNIGRSCVGDCKRAFMGGDEYRYANDQCLDAQSSWDSGGCMGRLANQCVSACVGNKTVGCMQGCYGECIPQCALECVNGCNPQACLAQCDSADIGKLCTTSCTESCVAEEHTKGPQCGPKYGYLKDLNHNLLVAKNGEGQVYLSNTYGKDLGSPHFDSVVSQTMGEFEVKAAYRDLEAEAAGMTSATLPGFDLPIGSWIDPVDSLSEFTSVEICPSICLFSTSLPPPIYVPWGPSLIRMGALASNNSGYSGWEIKASNLPKAGMPPTLLAISTSGKDTIATVRGSAPAWDGKFAFTLKRPGRTSITASPVSGGTSFVLSGTSSVLDELVKIGELTMLTDRSGVLRVYPGRPQGVLHVSEGQCTLPFRAETTSSNQLQITPGNACSDAITAEPLATLITDDALRTEYANHGSAGFVEQQLYQPSPLVRGRFAQRWMTSSSGKGLYEMAMGAGDGSASKSLETAAYQLSQVGLFDPPTDKDTKDEVPLYVLHLPETFNRAAITAILDTPIKFNPQIEFPGLTCDPVPWPSHWLTVGPKPARATVVLDPYGAYWIFYYDSRGRTIRQTNIGTGSIKSFNWDDEGNLTGIEEPNGARQCMKYTNDGLMREALSWPAPGALGSTTPILSKFDHGGTARRLTKVYDPRDPTQVMASLSYDAQGRLLSSATPLVGASTYNPKPWGAPAKITGPDGASVTEIDYDAATATVSETRVDALGQAPLVTQMSADSAGRPLKTTSPLGETTSWTWTGPVVTDQKRAGEGYSDSLTYEYDGDHRLKAVVSSEATTRIQYDALAFPLVTVKQANDGSAATQTSCTRRGPDGRLLEAVSPEGRRVRLSYDFEGHLRRVEAGALPASSLAWDDACASSYTGDGGAVGGIQREIKYDTSGRPITIRDARGMETHIEYDGFSRAAIVREAGGASARYGYDALGHVVWRAVYGPEGATVPYGQPWFGQLGLLSATFTTYDAAGRLQKTEAMHFDTMGAPIGDGYATESYTYDVANRRVIRTDDAGFSTSTRFDGAGRPVEVNYPTGDYVKTSYSMALRTSTRSWSAPTPGGTEMKSVRLTPFGAPQTVWGYADGEWRILNDAYYDEKGRVQYAVNAAGAGTTYDYDAFGRLTSEVRGYGDEDGSEAVLYSWTLDNELYKRTSYGGGGLESATVGFVYDALGRTEKRSGPTGIVDATTYLGLSMLPETTTDGRGAVTSYEYLPTNQVSKRTAQFSSGAANKRVRSFTYDGLGRVVNAVDYGSYLEATADDITTTLVWDSLGNKLREWNSELGPDDGPQHTVDGRSLTRTTTIAGVKIDRDYDALGRATTIKLNDESTPAITQLYAGLGGPTQLQRSSGLDTTLAYDGLGRLISQKDSKASGAVATWRWSIPLDGVPRLAGLRRGSSLEVASLYRTDLAARVLAEDNQRDGLESCSFAAGADRSTAPTQVGDKLGSKALRSYDWDGRHNWRSVETHEGTTKLDADAFDRYPDFGADEAKYDDRGALTQLGMDTYHYNAFGEVIEAARGEIGRYYEYDAFGRRVVEHDSLTGEATRFAFDGSTRILASKGEGEAEIFVDGALDQHVLSVQSSGERRFYHQDRSRNVYMLSSASGEPLEWYEYTAFGEMNVLTDGNAQPTGNRFGYQGQWFDDAIGVVDMRARLYRPSLGRFISPDPLGLAAGSNAFAFVMGAPMTMWDPFGLDGQDVNAMDAGVPLPPGGLPSDPHTPPLNYQGDMAPFWGVAKVLPNAAGATADALAGSINGLVGGGLWDHASFGHDDWFFGGQYATSTIMMGVDNVAIGGGGVLVAGGGTCIAVSGGVCAAPGGLAIATGGGLVAAGGFALPYHESAQQNAVDQIFQQADEGGTSQAPGQPSPGTSLEGAREHDVLRANGQTITDIDHIEGGVLWEEKTATGWFGEGPTWIPKNINGKFNKYMEARTYLPGYENAPIGFRFLDEVSPAFRADVEAAVAKLQADNPGVTILLEFLK
jgi:RHS repeat-associated protein